VPTLLFNITHGFQARMLLRSRISEALLEAGAKLVVLSQNADEPYFQRELSHPGITLAPLPLQLGRLEARLVKWRQYLLMNPALGTTLNHKREAFRQAAPVKAAVVGAGNLVLGRVPALRQAYLAMERGLYGGQEFDALLAHHRPDLVVSGTPGFHPADIHLLRAAARQGIRSATVMLSWDNLTSKGYMGAVPDDLLVWSPLMADEAQRYHDYPRDQIHWTGAAQFDHYATARAQAAQNRAALGVGRDRALIVYGTINPDILPHEPQIVADLVRRLRAGALSRPYLLWIRLHPQVVKGPRSGAVQTYLSLAGDDVRVEVPPVQSDKLAWDLPRDDSAHLAALLSAADVVLTPGSTLVIDAAAAGTPAASIGWDAGPVPAALSVRRFAGYTHYAQLLATGGVPVVDDPLQLLALVRAYLDDPTLHRAEREALLHQQLGRLDGLAGERTANTLLDLARQGPRRRA
jgi:hypothetical protein